MKLLLLTSVALAGPFALGSNLHANVRSSANYSITTETTSLGGQRTEAASYAIESSISEIAGSSSTGGPATVAKHGYIAQLGDLRALALKAATASVSEGASVQLDAWQILDDESRLAVPGASVAWSIQSGPLSQISIGGLANAGSVYRDSAAIVRGSFLGSTATLALTVTNTSADDFDAYAGDGIPDDWQIQYFGMPPNPNAGPNVDFSGTGQTNRFKYLAGLDPLDPDSRFVLEIAPVPDPLHPGQFLSGQKNLTFSPRFADRIYTVTSSPNPRQSFAPLTNPSPPSDDGTKRTVTDLDAGGRTKFYRIDISSP